MRRWRNPGSRVDISRFVWRFDIAPITKLYQLLRRNSVRMPRQGRNKRIDTVRQCHSKIFPNETGRRLRTYRISRWRPLAFVIADLANAGTRCGSDIGGESIRVAPELSASRGGQLPKA